MPATRSPSRSSAPSAAGALSHAATSTAVFGAAGSAPENKRISYGDRNVPIARADDSGEREADALARDALSGTGLNYAPGAPSLRPAYDSYLPDDLAARLHQARRGGEALPENQRREFESRFQSPLSDVRVHRDEAADELVRSVGARAFAYDTDVFLRRDAGNGFGGERRLLAHELGHVIQQRHTGPVIQRVVDDTLRRGDRVVIKRGRRGIVREHDSSAREYRVRIDDPQSSHNGRNGWYSYDDLDLVPQPAAAAVPPSRKRKDPAFSDKPDREPQGRERDRGEERREPKRKKRKKHRTEDVGSATASSSSGAYPSAASVTSSAGATSAPPPRRARSELTDADQIVLYRFYTRDRFGGGALDPRKHASPAEFQRYMNDEAHLRMDAQMHKENLEAGESPFLSMTVDPALAAEAGTIHNIVYGAETLGTFRLPASRVVPLSGDPVSRREGEVLALLAPGESLESFPASERANPYRRMDTAALRSHHDQNDPEGREFMGLHPLTWLPQFRPEQWATLRDRWGREDAEDRAKAAVAIGQQPKKPKNKKKKETEKNKRLFERLFKKQ